MTKQMNHSSQKPADMASSPGEPSRDEARAEMAALVNKLGRDTALKILRREAQRHKRLQEFVATLRSLAPDYEKAPGANTRHQCSVPLKIQAGGPKVLPNVQVDPGLTIDLVVSKSLAVEFGLKASDVYVCVKSAGGLRLTVRRYGALDVSLCVPHNDTEGFAYVNSRYLEVWVCDDFNNENSSGADMQCTTPRPFGALFRDDYEFPKIRGNMKKLSCVKPGQQPGYDAILGQSGMERLQLEISEEGDAYCSVFKGRIGLSYS